MIDVTYSFAARTLLLLLMGMGILAGLIVLIVRRPKLGLSVLVVVAALAVAGLVSMRTVVLADRRGGAIVVAPVPALIPPTPATPLIRVPLPEEVVPAEGATTRPAGSSGKAWVDNWVAFVNAPEQSNRRWIRVESPGYAATEQEAHLAAQRAAVESLKPYVQQQLMIHVSGTPVKIAIDERRIERQLAASLAGQNVVHDRFVERVSRPYAELWREMMLIDASPATIDRLAMQCAAAARQQLGRAASGWGALAALVLVIILAYAFLNAATRGYLVWRLRAIAVLAIIAAVLAAMAMA